jgi:dipeptide/tripeptide permease
MSTEKRSILQTLGSFKKTFWIASAMELFERWAWYGIFTLLAIYLVGSTDEGGLGFSHTEKGQLMGFIPAILYLLPLFTGVIADKIGYKLSLIIAYTMLIIGYYLMGTVTSYWSVFFVFLFVALGAALFKPVASAIVTKSTDNWNSTLGFGIFYMMVNIGGFIGPAMSSGLRSTYGWKLIFIQASIVIAINLLIVIFLFKEPYREVTKETFGQAIINSVRKIWEAIKDVRLTVLLIIMVGFWTLFMQLFNTLPNFIEDWVDSSALSQSVTEFWPWLGNLISDGGQVKPEWFTNIDALMIVFLQIFVSYFVLKMRHVSAMIRGFIIATIGIGITFYTQNVWFTVIGTIIFAIGEMTTNPTFSSFIAIISPRGKEALYQGTYFLPVAAGNFFTAFISGNLYEAWSDKLSLLQTEMTSRGIEMPEVTSEFSKNQYYDLASERLGMSSSEITQLLWNTYNPNKIWYVIVGIGIVTILALAIYDKLVIKPKEKLEKEAASN